MRLVHDRVDAAGAVGAYRHALPAGGPVADAAVICLRVNISLTGRRICLRRERGKQLVRPRGTRAAERAADERRDHPDLVDRATPKASA